MTSALDRREAIERIGREVTAVLAGEVDRDSRFPHETIDALRAAGLLSLPVPVDSGGPGGDMAEVNQAIRILGGHDASVGLILTMHYSQIILLARHLTNATQREFLAEIHREQMLIANANSELTIRGDERRSSCALEPRPGGRFGLVKDTPVISYGEYADAIFVTARAGMDSVDNDQVIAIVRASDARVEPTGPWDALGLRGSRSRPFHLEATGDAHLVLPDYAGIVAATGLPVTNLMFAYFWLGMAEQAAAIAHGYARKRYRVAADSAARAVALLRLAELAAGLDRFRGVVAAATSTFDAVIDTDDVQRLDVIASFQTLKVNGAQLLAEIVQQALAVCGIAGYTYTSPYSLARQVRDALGVGLMVNNDSVHVQNGDMLMLRKRI